MSNCCECSIEHYLFYSIFKIRFNFSGIFQQVTPSEIDEEHDNHVYSTTHVGNVCEDSLDGRHLIQQNELTNTTNLQNGLKKQEGPVVRYFFQ